MMALVWSGLCMSVSADHRIVRGPQDRLLNAGYVTGKNLMKSLAFLRRLPRKAANCDRFEAVNFASKFDKSEPLTPEITS
jgi:hypothetical protein